MNIIREDIGRLAACGIDWTALDGCTVMVTGATGMLAAYVTRLLCHLHEECGIGVRVIALCRSRAKAEARLGDYMGREWFSLLLQDVCQPIEAKADIIFHLAGNASAAAITGDPVGIMRANLTGTMNVLECARRSNARRVVFASTREVYGHCEGLDRIAEGDMGTLDPLDPRSCYPESKRAAEALMVAYRVPFVSLRIAHSYGPGMGIDGDGRIMSDLMGNAVRGEDITLKSDGTAMRAFCYVTDAVEAIMRAAMLGKAGRAYNVANETEEVSIRDLAQRLATMAGVGVTFAKADRPGAYCAYRRVGLDTRAIETLGWRPRTTLDEGLERTYNQLTIAQGDNAG